MAGINLIKTRQALFSVRVPPETLATAKGKLNDNNNDLESNKNNSNNSITIMFYLLKFFKTNFLK